MKEHETCLDLTDYFHTVIKSLKLKVVALGSLEDIEMESAVVLLDIDQ